MAMDARLTFDDKQQIKTQVLEAIAGAPDTDVPERFDAAVLACWTDGLHRVEPRTPTAKAMASWGDTRWARVYRPSGLHVCTVVLRRALEAGDHFRVDVMIPTPKWPLYCIDEVEPGRFDVRAHTDDKSYGYSFQISEWDRLRCQADPFWQRVEHALADMRRLIEGRAA